MKVRMLEYQKGSNGIKTKEYKIGMVYKVPSDLSQYLAVAWLQKGICEIDNPVKVKIETKVIIPKETKEKSLIEKAMELIKPGKTNKSISEELGISIKELQILKKQIKSKK